jgi:ribosome-associated protein YbcJ (S4-like RNA binding protein)
LLVGVGESSSVNNSGGVGKNVAENEVFFNGGSDSH